MLLRLSHKLAKKIHEQPTESLPAAENPLADWSGHVFTAERTQYVIVTNTASLYSTIFLGRGITSGDQLVQNAVAGISRMMRHHAMESRFARFVAPAVGKVEFSKALNPSVTGSMTDLVKCAKIAIEDGATPLSAADFLNSMPMSKLGYSFPKEAVGTLPQ